MTTAVARPDLLVEGYRQAARLTRDNGTTYYWGTMLLPPVRRRHVYAVYALCRLADDIVDAPSATQGDNIPATAAALAACLVEKQFTHPDQLVAYLGLDHRSRR